MYCAVVLCAINQLQGEVLLACTLHSKQQSTDTSTVLFGDWKEEIKMPVYEMRLEKKIEDLEGSVEYLKDQNITLLKRLDQTTQKCETQGEQIAILSMFYEFFLTSLFQI